MEADHDPEGNGSPGDFRTRDSGSDMHFRAITQAMLGADWSEEPRDKGVSKGSCKSRKELVRPEPRSELMETQSFMESVGRAVSV